MKVILVEDSRVVAAYVVGVLRGQPGIDLAAPVADGGAGVAAILRQRPDVVLMDLELPGMHGVEAIREVMRSEAACPIVVLSAFLDAPDRDRTFEAIEAGAVEVIAKPRGLGEVDVRGFGERLVRTLRLMATARVVRRRFAPTKSPAPAEAADVALSPSPAGLTEPEVIAIGSSTGGPSALFDILRLAAPPLPQPIVIAQHIIPGFERGLADWLCETGHAVRVARDGDRLQDGTVLVVPADRDPVLHRDALALEPTRGGPAPSADRLFESACASYGPRALGILLTGMGADGARGLLALRRSGATTITQAGTTCVVDGMPAAARALGASVFELTPAEIGALLGAASPWAARGGEGAPEGVGGAIRHASRRPGVAAPRGS